MPAVLHTCSGLKYMIGSFCALAFRCITDRGALTCTPTHFSSRRQYNSHLMTSPRLKTTACRAMSRRRPALCMPVAALTTRTSKLTSSAHAQTITRNTAHMFCIRQYASFQDKYHLYLMFDLMLGGDLMDVLVAEAKVIRRRDSQGGWKRGCLAPKVTHLALPAKEHMHDGFAGSNASPSYAFFGYASCKGALREQQPLHSSAARAAPLRPSSHTLCACGR